MKDLQGDRDNCNAIVLLNASLRIRRKKEKMVPDIKRNYITYFFPCLRPRRSIVYNYLIKEGKPLKIKWLSKTVRNKNLHSRI